MARTVPSKLIVLLLSCAALSNGCGDDEGGPTSQLIVAKGSGSGRQNVSNGKLTIYMPIVDASKGLSEFSKQADTYFGANKAKGGFRVTDAKLVFDRGASKGLLGFNKAFAPGKIEISLAPLVGTTPAAVFGTLSTPDGNGEYNVNVNGNKSVLEGLKGDIDSISVIVDGPTNWTGGEDYVLAASVEFHLQALPPS